MLYGKPCPLGSGHVAFSILTPKTNVPVHFHRFVYPGQFYIIIIIIILVKRPFLVF